MVESSHEEGRGFSAKVFWLGTAFLLVSVVASVVLVGKHLDVLSAPGCGEGSPCERAAASAWGRVPGIGWPVSFVGLAYFTALVPGWIAARRNGSVPPLYRYTVWAGAALSVMFLLAMTLGRYACPYCIAAHAGNFCFLFVVEAAPRAAGGAGRVLGWAAAAFVVLTGVEIGLDAALEQKVERQLSKSTQQIIEASKAPPGRTADPQDAQAGETGEAFTGRYRIGPADAPIRLVIISDFQCPDCQRIEKEVEGLLAKRDDMSLSTKHHPFCQDCNDFVSTNPHPNACWAARAAEAAGILRGDEGYFQMHRWLFDRKGSFTDAEIESALLEFGYDVKEFLTVMQGPETLHRVKDDIDEARALGIHYTPMIFINGVELKGWSAVDAVTRAVEALAETDPPPGTAAQDHPPTAREKYVADWRDQPAVPLPPDTVAWTMGAEHARADIVVWGDYQEPFTAQADKLLRTITDSRSDTSYTFRHYPILRECNPVTPVDFHPQACQAARAAEAAGSLGGSEAYWAMHRWLMGHQEEFSESTLADAALEIGIHPDDLLMEMQQPEIAAAIEEDARAGKRIGLRGVPLIYINNRRVPRWKLPGILDAMVDAAAGTTPPED